MTHANDDLTFVPDLMTILEQVHEAQSFDDLQRCLRGIQHAVPETAARDVAYLTDVIAHLRFLHDAAREDRFLARTAGDAAVLITRLVMRIGTRAMAA